jgi:hypothetical protein
MAPKGSIQMSLFSRIMVFIGIYIATLVAVLTTEWLQDCQLAILIIPLIAYLSIFFIEAKTRINKGFNYDEVWKGCFWFSFWTGASLTLPFIIFRVGPEGPIKFQDFRISYLVANLFGCAVFGGLAGLVGTVLINQFYGLLGGDKSNFRDKNNS